MDVIASTECAGSCRAEGGASPGVAPTAVRLAFCSRCWTRFAVCRACDRCQVYCGRRCSEQARLENLREIRRRYRRTERGRAAHREQERRRRQRRCSLPSAPASVGDQGGVQALRMILCSKLASAAAGNQDQEASAPAAAGLRCHSCARTARFVQVTAWHKSRCTTGRRASRGPS